MIRDRDRYDEKKPLPMLSATWKSIAKMSMKASESMTVSLVNEVNMRSMSMGKRL